MRNTNRNIYIKIKNPGIVEKSMPGFMKLQLAGLKRNIQRKTVSAGQDIEIGKSIIYTQFGI